VYFGQLSDRHADALLHGKEGIDGWQAKALNLIRIKIEGSFCPREK
jgi:hypothetical protein